MAFTTVPLEHSNGLMCSLSHLGGLVVPSVASDYQRYMAMAYGTLTGVAAQHKHTSGVALGDTGVLEADGTAFDQYVAIVSQLALYYVEYHGVELPDHV